MLGGGADDPGAGGEGLPRINALVDRYNAVSVLHAVPVGGEDLDRVSGPVRLVAASGDEPFDDEHPRPGEIVWADALGVTCRRWNWRQCRRTRLVEGTTRAYFLFDALPPFGDAELAAAMAELEGLLRGGWPEARLESWVVRAPANVNCAGWGSGVSPGCGHLTAHRGSSDTHPAEPSPQCRS